MNYEYNNIYNIDCLEGMKELPDNYVDITITSPPYNVGKAIGVGGVDMYDGYKDNLKGSDYYVFMRNVVLELLRVSRHHVFFNFQKLSNNRESFDKLICNFNHKIKETFIWAKTNPPASIHPYVASSGYEYIVCFSNEDCKVRNFKYCNFNNRDKTSGKMGKITVSNCIINGINQDNQHPGIHACFPLWLPTFFIRYFSKEDAVIFDPFMGSGTTAVVAKKLGRRFLGFELVKDRYEYARSRVENVPERWF